MTASWAMTAVDSDPAGGQPPPGGGTLQRWRMGARKARAAILSWLGFLILLAIVVVACATAVVMFAAAQPPKPSFRAHDQWAPPDDLAYRPFPRRSHPLEYRHPATPPGRGHRQGQDRSQ